MKLGELLTKHRNLFLIVLLGATLAVSSTANQERLRASSPTVEIPVMAVAALSPLEAYRQQRDADTLTDIAALERLVAQATLDAQTRDAAAEQLQAIIDARQAQSALEGALISSSLAPCVAVVAHEAVTIVTEKSTVTDRDTAMVLALVAAHIGVQPQNVRIITAK